MGLMGMLWLGSPPSAFISCPAALGGISTLAAELYRESIIIWIEMIGLRHYILYHTIRKQTQ